MFQSSPAREIIVAVMDDDPVDIDDCSGVPVKVVRVPEANDCLPLAAARNLAASHATGDLLVFLDVDCLPEERLIQSYHAVSAKFPNDCLMGEVFYLPALPNEELQPPRAIQKLPEMGIRHPSKREFLKVGSELEPDHGELWGLNFALRRQVFENSGGFDPSFVGYGGEETDFAALLKQKEIALRRVAKAAAFHQHHAVHIPPVPHFSSIVRNANLFKSKHGHWCMNYWLEQFVSRGWIEWSAAAKFVRVLKEPTDAERLAALQPDDVRFS